MRKSEFISLIQSPELVQKEQIMGLQEVIAEYPYFSSAHLLLTKAYQESENLNYEKQLRLSAAYAADRRKLHELLFETAQEEGSPVAESQVIEMPETPALVDVGSTDPDDSSAQELSEEDAFLESQILSSAINSSILQEVGDDESGIKETTEEIHQSQHTNKAEEGFDEEEPHSFSDWLNHYGGNSEIVGPSPQSAAIKAISDQAKSIQKKAEFFSASKMAKLSVIESDDLVTETLAQVYEAQGKYERAIQAYQKLQLKFPEKRVYFAGRIKAVEEKLKS